MNVLLVDDQSVIHEVARGLVRKARRGAKLHVATDLEAAIALGRELDDLRLALLELNLPGCAGIEALTRLRAALPGVPVLVYCGNHEPALIRATLDAGAAGYLSKSTKAGAMVAVVRLVLAGVTYVPSEALRGAPKGGQRAPRLPTSAYSSDLTARQSEVLNLLLCGLSNEQIGRQLGISENTVKQHLHCVFHAFGVSSRSQLIAAASRRSVRLN